MTGGQKIKSAWVAVAYWSDEASSWYTWDDDCEGAICGPGSVDDPIAMFETRADARKAIEVSKAFARLRKAQGKIANDDFLCPDCLKCIHIVPLQAKGGA